jgi:lysophospholipase L1-like esterase
LDANLAPGEHELRLVKRTEGSQGDATLLGLGLAPGAQLLAPPAARPLRLVFYGDSITAGACNGDLGADQYEDLSTHDGTRAYSALTAERLGADYYGQAVSGIGITATWHDMLQHQVWDRVAPRLDALVAPPDPAKPEVVIVNLGQNDHGFPNAMGQQLASDFGARYLHFLRLLRQRHPDARLVIAIGGMTAWKDEPRLAQALNDAYNTLRKEGDARVWRYTFQAFAYAHPRIDVHAQMADELTHFLRTEVFK